VSLSDFNSQGSANSRAYALYNLNGQSERRAVPPKSGAIASWGAEWSRIMELLANPLGEALPEIKRKTTMWIVRATGVALGPAFFDLRRDTDPPGRRAVPEAAGAQACWGGGWAKTIDLLGDSILDACPEINHRLVQTILRGRPNGLRIEFFADEAAFNRRRQDRAADLVDGLQIHCGGRNGLIIEFFDDDAAFRKRLDQIIPGLTGTVQIHAGRLTWM
jgi:hypothetical protein